MPATNSPLGFLDSWAGSPALGVPATNTQGVDVDQLFVKMRVSLCARMLALSCLCLSFALCRSSWWQLLQCWTECGQCSRYRCTQFYAAGSLPLLALT